jgi:hypothetical protein
MQSPSTNMQPRPTDGGTLRSGRAVTCAVLATAPWPCLVGFCKLDGAFCLMPELQSTKGLNKGPASHPRRQGRRLQLPSWPVLYRLGYPFRSAPLRSGISLPHERHDCAVGRFGDTLSRFLNFCGWPKSDLPPWTILYGFRYVMGLDVRCAFEVGDGAG